MVERALRPKYCGGEAVYFTASNVARPAATGTYEVIRLLPTDGDDCQYRIKSSAETFERVPKERQHAGSRSWCSAKRQTGGRVVPPAYGPGGGA